jgi:hypothetical protein
MSPLLSTIVMNVIPDLHATIVMTVTIVCMLTEVMKEAPPVVVVVVVAPVAATTDTRETDMTDMTEKGALLPPDMMLIPLVKDLLTRHMFQPLKK